MMLICFYSNFIMSRCFQSSYFHGNIKLESRYQIQIFLFPYSYSSVISERCQTSSSQNNSFYVCSKLLQLICLDIYFTKIIKVFETKWLKMAAFCISYPPSGYFYPFVEFTFFLFSMLFFFRKGGSFYKRVKGGTVVAHKSGTFVHKSLFCTQRHTPEEE